jgi:riboflavin biosynthesis pyrimidine reductase
MREEAVVRRLWPDPAVLDDAALVAGYAPADRSVPLVRMNFVTSLDGAVTVAGLSDGLTTTADQHVFRTLRMLSDVVLVGAGTLRAERYQPLRVDEARQRWRVEHGLPANPVLAVVSNRLAELSTMDTFTAAPVRPIVFTHAASPPGGRAELAAVADVVVCGDDRVVDLPAAVAALAGRGLPQVLCEGGPHLFGALDAAGVVDELCLSVSPLLVGAGAGRIIAGQTSPAAADLAVRQVLSADDGTLFLRYAVLDHAPSGDQEATK